MSHYPLQLFFAKELYCLVTDMHQTSQFPSHGLGEPVAYGFQTLAKGAAL